MEHGTWNTIYPPNGYVHIWLPFPVGPYLVTKSHFLDTRRQSERSESQVDASSWKAITKATHKVCPMVQPELSRKGLDAPIFDE